MHERHRGLQPLAGGTYTHLHDHPVVRYFCVTVRYSLLERSSFAASSLTGRTPSIIPKGSIFIHCKLVPHILGRHVRPAITRF